VGRTLDVLVDMVEAGTPVGRSYRQAPEIDGVVILDRGRPGEWVQAEVTAAYETDLEARVV
jgi:ribosomal protein S12 methylthiotransferase